MKTYLPTSRFLNGGKSVKQIHFILIVMALLAVSFHASHGQVSLVKKIYIPSGENTFAYEFKGMTLHRGNLYFLFNQELWKSDGTSNGTVLIKRFDNITGIVSSGNYIYFTAQEHDNGEGLIHGAELWRSDGTPQGTMMVKDIFPGPTGSDARYLTNVNGTLFFVANNGINGNELWKSKGSAGGTMLVKDITPDSEPLTGHPSL